MNNNEHTQNDGYIQGSRQTDYVLNNNPNYQGYQQNYYGSPQGPYRWQQGPYRGPQGPYGGPQQNYGYQQMNYDNQPWQHEYKKKSSEVACVLCLLLGGLGVHRFYCGKIVTGIIWLFTLGCFGIGAFIDFILILSGNFKDGKGEYLEADMSKKSKMFAIGFYIIAFIIGIILIGMTSEGDTQQTGNYTYQYSENNNSEHDNIDVSDITNGLNISGNNTQSNVDIKIEGTTVSQQNALKSAERYLDIMAFSYSGLVNQLEYEGYPTGDAKWAADNCGANWSEQALLSAQNYINTMPFSYTGLINQLEYEGFTAEQAEYGVENCDADWYEQAVKSAANYLDTMPFSRQSLINQLEYEGFTTEQAIYGVEQNGL